MNTINVRDIMSYVNSYNLNVEAYNRAKSGVQHRNDSMSFEDVMMESLNEMNRCIERIHGLLPNEVEF